jgi:hypothetical protein
LGEFPEDWGSTWNPLREMTQAEIAKVQLDNSQRDERYVNADIVPRAAVATQLKSDGVYEAIDDKFIEALKEVEGEPATFEPEPGV